MKQDEAIDGLDYLQQFVSQQAEKQLVDFILQQQWNNSLKRRTQHYGYTYSYNQNNKLENAQPIPKIMAAIKQEIGGYLFDHHNVVCEFDQIIVNQYLPGQGISPHIDNQQLFGPIVVSLSLASNTTMLFQDSKGRKVQKMLMRRSLLILGGDSRSKWKHSIASRKFDNGVARSTRYSLTFRKVINA